MLDFYLISDSEGKPKPDQLEHLDYAGSVESDMSGRLVRKGIIDSRFDEYSDFRWGKQLIKQIEAKANKFNADSDVLKLKEIIEKAKNKEFGLIAFGD